MIEYLDILQGSEEWDAVRRNKLTASRFDEVMSGGVVKTADLVDDLDVDSVEIDSRAKKQIEVFELIVKNGATDTKELNPSGLKGLVEKEILHIKAHDSLCNLSKDKTERHIDCLIAKSMFTDSELGIYPPSDAMERGNYYEDNARIEFEMMTGLDVEQIGFVINHDISSMIGCSPDGLINDRREGLEIKCPLPHNHLTYLRKGEMPSKYRAQVHGNMAITGADSWYFMSYCPKLPPLLLKIQRSEYTENMVRCLKQFDIAYVTQLEEMKESINYESESNEDAPDVFDALGLEQPVFPTIKTT